MAADERFKSRSGQEKPSGEQWYRTEEVASRLNIAYGTVLHYAGELKGKLQARRTGSNKRYEFSASDIEILRQHLRRPKRSGLTVGQMAAQLGVTSFQLRKIVNQLKAILPRPEDDRPGTYKPEAVEILRKQLQRTARKTEATDPSGEYWRAVATLKDASGKLAEITQNLKETHKRLRNNPPSVIAYIHVLPAEEWHLEQPIAAVVSPLRRGYWRASFAEARMQGIGRSQDDAVLALQAAIVSALRDPETPGEQRAVLQQLVRRRGRKKA